MLQFLLITAMLLPARAEPPADPLPEFQHRFQELVREGQPADGENAFELVGEVNQRIRAIAAQVVGELFPAEDPEQVALEALADPASTQQQKDMTRAVLEGLMKSDVPDLAARLARAPRGIGPGGEVVLIDRHMPYLGYYRRTARFESGRMALAQERRDSAEWLRAFEELLKLSEQPGREPILISVLVGIAMESMALRCAHRFIAGGCSEAEMIRIAELIRAQPWPPVDRALRGESMMALDALEYMYDTGPAGIAAFSSDGGPFPPRPERPVIPVGVALGEGMPERGEHRALFEGYYEDLRVWARLPRAQRTSSPLADSLSERERSSLLLGIMAPAYGKLGAAVDQLGSDRIGLLSVIALERCKLARGAYPETLAELAPDFLPWAPTDPFTDGPLGYLPPSRGPYTGGRAYVLYVAGNNLRDDGGRVDFEDRYRVNTADGDGDLLLNFCPPERRADPAAEGK